MLKKATLFFVTLLISYNISAQNHSNCNCNYTVNSWYWKLDGADMGNMPNITIHDSLVASTHPITNIGNNPFLSLKGGDVICVDASVPYSFLRWENIIGSPGNPIIIKNVGGQVQIKNLTNAGQQVVASYGWVFRKSKYFKILGDGDPKNKYGFKVTTHLNSYIQMIDQTSDFEIAYVEVAGDYPGGTNFLSGFAGIMAKSQPICWDDPNGGSTDSSNFELRNVFIHDNYIHDVGAEGMYIGYGKSQGVRLNGCSKVNYPHNVRNLYVYNNIIDNVGWDGIQIKNAHYNAQVYNNVIKNYGNKLNGAHDEGLFVGDGSEALIYGNWIENGTNNSNGMQINAFGNTEIYNNVILGSGSYGLYLNNQSPQFANRAGTFKIYNNTIEGGSNKFGLAAYTPQNVIVKNNIIFGFVDDSLYADGIKTQSNSIVSSNIVESDASMVGFENYSTKDIRLKMSSSAIDSGENNIYFDKHDFTTTLRTDGKIDIGAIERSVVINNSTVNVTITTPSSSSIVVASGQAIPIKASLIDINNKVKMVQYFLNNRLIGTDAMPRKTEHVIGNQHLLVGNNTFKIKVTLYSGVTFFSNSISIFNPPQVASRSSILSVEEDEKAYLEINYYIQTKELVITNPNNTQIQTIEIYDLQGNKVKSWSNVNNDAQSVNKRINGLLSGVYVVKIKTNQQYFSKKVLLISN